MLHQRLFDPSLGQNLRTSRPLPTSLRPAGSKGTTKTSAFEATSLDSHRIVASTFIFTTIEILPTPISTRRKMDDVSFEAPEAGRLPCCALNANHHSRYPCTPAQHQDRLGNTGTPTAATPRHSSPVRYAPLTRNVRTDCTRKDSSRIL